MFANGWNGNVQPRRVRRHHPDALDSKELKLSRWQKVAFPILLLLAHSLFRWMVALYRTGRRWLRLAKGKLHFLAGSATLSLACLTKKPLHVAFAVQEAPLNVVALAHWIAWAVVCDIANVSVYDHDGEIKKRSNELYQEIRRRMSREKRRSSIFKWRDQVNDPVTFSVENCSSIPSFSEEDCDLHATNISVLSVGDGRGDVAAAGEAIALMVKKGELDVDRVDERVVGSLLKSNKGMPDPDLLIRFGLTSCNMGFLPWQIRLTEIYDHSSHVDVDFEDFFLILRKFSKCEQRFGR